MVTSRYQIGIKIKTKYNPLNQNILSKLYNLSYTVLKGIFNTLLKSLRTFY